MKKQDDTPKNKKKINLKNIVITCKSNMAKINYLLLFFMLLYAVFGLVMILSASSIAAVLRYDVSTNYFFNKQLLFFIVSFVFGFLVVIHIPTKYYKYISKLGIGLILFFLVIVFFKGKTIGGAKSWYELGFFNIQPTEFAKVALIIYLALYYHKLNVHKSISFFDMIKPLGVAALTCILIALQPDMGGAGIVFFITFMIFISLPIAKKHKRTIIGACLIMVTIIGVALLILGKNILSSYQVSRILNFRNPCERYAEDSGYQVCNGYIAIHNGGLFGVGLGQSTQKYLYLPEAHTDFIFPIICEELGIVVGIIVVLGYILMLFVILDIAKSTSNLRNSILAYGVFAYLLAHILINLLGVLGLIPLTGVPLPFLSYGGSYNISVVIALFIVQRINIENKIDFQRKRIENL